MWRFPSRTKQAMSQAQIILEPPGRPSLLPMTALVIGALLIQVGNSALNVLVPLTMAVAGRSPAEIGIVASAYSLGFLAGCMTIALLVRRVAHIRAFAILAAIQASLTIAFGLVEHPAAWAMFRLISGFTSAGLFVVSDSWLNERVPPSHRGRLLGLYNLFARIAQIVGQVVPAYLFLPTPLVFAVISVLFSMALVPVGLSGTTGPAAPDAVRLRFREVWTNAPVSVVGSFYVGLIGGAIVSVFPAFAVFIGVQPADVGFLAAAVQVGPLIAQWPLGILSDRIDRRLVMVGCAVVMVSAVALLMVVGTASYPILFIALCVIGAGSLPIYALSVAHAFDRADPRGAVALSSTLLFIWASGSVVGPLLAAWAMDRYGPNGYFGLLIAAGVLFVAFAAFRMRMRPR